MAVFTELSCDEVAAFFRALGLGQPRSVRGIMNGIENTNYFVDTDGQSMCSRCLSASHWSNCRSTSIP